MNRIEQNNGGLRSNLAYNDSVKANTDFLDTLKDKLPEFFTNSGSFDLDKFKENLKENNIDELFSGYQLDFIGKNYAKKQAGERPTTVIVPDRDHNEKDENKNSKNLFFTGDNLEVLRHLRQNYQNSIDVIYIDPPYNTGSDGFVYPDKFEYNDENLKDMFGLNDDELRRLKSIQGRSSHSAWLTFMYPRLAIARKLLKDTGVIFISIDENEYASLKMAMDEIFGESGFIENITWDKKSSAKGVPPKTMMAGVHEYILSYQKKDEYKFVGVERNAEEDGFSNPDNDPRGPWRESNIRSTTVTPDKAFTIVNPDNGKEYTNTWAFSKSSLEQMIFEGRILWKDSLPKQKEYMLEMTNENKAIISDFGVFDAQNNTVYLRELFGVEKMFSNPKPIELMKYLLSVASPKDAVILDFFAGSATTADAVMRINDSDGGTRKYLLAQINEPTYTLDVNNVKRAKKGSEAAFKAGYLSIDQISRTRIEKAAEKIKTENPLLASSLDLGFKHYRVEEVAVNTIDRMEEFDPNVMFTEDLVADVQGGVDTILTTWMVADGYKFDESVQKVNFGGADAYYLDNQLLYILDNKWNAMSTKELLNQIGNHKININTIIVSEYALTFNHMSELKSNIKLLKDKDFNVKVEVRG